MSEALVSAGTLQDKVFARIRESIGDLMTDEDLKRLVEAAMQDAFFKPRTIGLYNEKKPPLIVELVDQMLRDRIDLALKTWLEEHNDLVLKTIDERLSAGAVQFLISSFESRFSFALNEFSRNVSDALQVRR